MKATANMTIGKKTLATPHRSRAGRGDYAIVAVRTSVSGVAIVPEVRSASFTIASVLLTEIDAPIAVVVTFAN